MCVIFSFLNVEISYQNSNFLAFLKELKFLSFLYLLRRIKIYFCSREEVTAKGRISCFNDCILWCIRANTWWRFWDGLQMLSFQAKSFLERLAHIWWFSGILCSIYNLKSTPRELPITQALLLLGFEVDEAAKVNSILINYNTRMITYS